MRPPHKVEVSVVNKNILLINVGPRFDLGDGVCRGLPLWYRVLGKCESTTKKPVPIFPLKSDMCVKFDGIES